MLAEARESSGWRARLELAFARAPGSPRTVLARRRHTGPLVVQRPFYPEGNVCHVYLVHPPGGIVAGDSLELEVVAEPGSHSLLTTPAATRFYRAAAGRTAVLRQQLHLQGAMLEWLPQETIFFRDADARSSTVVHMDRESRFIGWEIACYGRPAGDELFTAGRLRQDFDIHIDGAAVLLDRLRMDGGAPPMQARWGLAGRSVLGTLIACPAAQGEVDAVRAALRGADGTAEASAAPQFACSLVDGVLLCRALGNGSDEVRALLLRAWQVLRPRLMQRECALPRIWAT
jgi:urease accessory protein